MQKTKLSDTHVLFKTKTKNKSNAFFFSFSLKLIFALLVVLRHPHQRAGRDTILHLDANKFISPKEFLKKGKRRGK